jgi:ankyrin repeat protein
LIDLRNSWEIEKLFKRKLDPNVKYQKETSFFLLSCEKCKDFTIPLLFLEYGANPNVVNSKGESPLTLICQNKKVDEEIISKILERKADVNHKNSKGLFFKIK